MESRASLRSASVRWVAGLAVALVAVAASPSPAQAFTGPLGGNTSSGSWLNYATTRYVSDDYSPTKVAFDPAYNTMLQYSSTGQDLALRLLNVNGTVLSSPQVWGYDPGPLSINDHGQKTIMTGLAVDYGFRMSVCCYHGNNNDQAWSGTIYY